MRTHSMNIITKGIAGVALLAALAACGNGLNSTTSSSGTTNPSAIFLGSGTGTSFVKGVLSVSTKTLSAGGSTSITATLVNSAGTLDNQSVVVTFNSPCSSSGQASITDSSGTSGSVTAAAGTAIATYTAKGCQGSDTITATATVGSATLTATGVVTVAKSTLGSIQFVSATPSTITLKGMGGAGLQETSTIIFAVKDSVGGAVSGATVSFALVSSTGGVTLSQSTAISDANGNAQTIVKAGTHAGPIVVQASVVASGVTISTSSSGLAIQSGIPSQSHFSLAVDTYNPEGYDIDGKTSTLTVHLADRFGNPVPDKTTVSFITSNLNFGAGGNVGPSCETGTGTCSVTWTSQAPRPSDIASDQHIGFAYILAYANGEESFTDVNGDGVFDDATGVAEPFSDIPEIYAPSAQFATSGATSSYVPGEPFYDFNNDGVHNNADGNWEGVNCQETVSGKCGTRTSTGVGTYTCIVMAGSAAAFSSAQLNGSATAITGNTITAPSAVTVSAAVSDENGNVLPAGTTIGLDTSNLTGGSAILTPSSSGSYTVGNTTCAGSAANWPARFVITFTVTLPPLAGSIGLLVTTPSGTVSELIINMQ